MKIFFNLIKALFVLLILFLLAQNANQSVTVSLLNYSFQGVKLYIVIILSIALGALFGSIFMISSVIQARNEMRDIRRKNRQLQKELESLRNVSIDEIPEEEEDSTNV